MLPHRIRIYILIRVHIAHSRCHCRKRLEGRMKTRGTESQNNGTRGGGEQSEIERSLKRPVVVD